MSHFHSNDKFSKICLVFQNVIRYIINWSGYQLISVLVSFKWQQRPLITDVVPHSVYWRMSAYFSASLLQTKLGRGMRHVSGPIQYILVQIWMKGWIQDFFLSISSTLRERGFFFHCFFGLGFLALVELWTLLSATTLVFTFIHHPKKYDFVVIMLIQTLYCLTSIWCNHTSWCILFNSFSTSHCKKANHKPGIMLWAVSFLKTSRSFDAINAQDELNSHRSNVLQESKSMHVCKAKKFKTQMNLTGGEQIKRLNNWHLFCHVTIKQAWPKTDLQYMAVWR